MGRSLVFALAAAATACSDAAVEPPRAAEPELAELAEIGYASWEPGADAGQNGVTRWDRARSAGGYNVYTNDRDEVYVLDMAGRRLHTWRVPGGRRVEYGELVGGGRVAVVDVDRGVLLLERDSRVVWELVLAAHHDVAALPGGGFVAPYHELVPYRGRSVRFDGLAWISDEGAIERRWSARAHLTELQRCHPPLALDRAPPEAGEEDAAVYDYYHLNSVEPLTPTPLGERDERFRAGNLLLCMRNANLIAILDRDSLEVVWHWRPGTIDMPHMPTWTPEGHVLLFDNGPHRGHSRLVELDPVSGAVVWRYSADPPQAFFSEWRGSVQRLPGGNTLACEAERGRAFEVTPEGELVWEFWNPELQGDERRRIYRLLRVQAGELDWLSR